MAKLIVFQTPGICPPRFEPGTEIEVYATCTCEMTGFPQTLNEIDPVVNINPGDTVELGANFDFSAAPSGSGYWRRYLAVVNKNKIDYSKVGEEGSESLTSGLTFTIAGTAKEQIEFSDCLVKLSGCLSMMIRPRGSAELTGIGRPALPATIDTLAGDSGEKAGDPNVTVYRVKNDAKPWVINDTNFPIELTPNP